MIGYLSGKVIAVRSGDFLLDVNGVGYEVGATPRLLGKLGVGQPAAVTIETLVAETYIRLIGFETEEERAAFRLLQTVQGVGSKAALSILTVLSPGALYDAVALGDKTAVARAQGVGPKLAQRVVTELKDKTSSLLPSAPLSPTATGTPTEPQADTQGAARRDALAALMALGFDEGAALRALAGVTGAEDADTGTLVTAALKSLAPA